MKTSRLTPTRDAITVLRRGWRPVLAVAVAGGLVALLACALQSPVYEATTSMYVTSGTTQRPSTAYEDVMGSQNRVNSYVQLAYSDAVLAPALTAAGLGMDLAAVRNAVHAQAAPGTVVLRIGVRDHDPAIARRLADSVAAELTNRVAALEVPTGGGKPTSRLTVLDRASINPVPVSPNTSILVTLGVLLGLFLGVVAVLTRERMNDRIRDELDVEKTIGSGPLAVVPYDQHLEVSRTVDFTHSAGADGAAAAFRHLRASLSTGHPPLRRLAVSSLSPGDGKTTVAKNLAIALVESGESVVLVDANLDATSPTKRKRGRDTPGLADAIDGQSPLPTVVMRGCVDGLAAVGPGWAVDRNGAGLLSSRDCGTVIDQLAERFTYVIVDAPSMMDCSGAEEMARWCDGMLLVVRRKHSRMSDLRRCVRRLSDVRSDLVGVVLNESRGAARVSRPIKDLTVQASTEPVESMAS